MSTQSTIEHRLNDLIEIARDGKSFYEEAATKVRMPNCRHCSPVSPGSRRGSSRR